VSYTIAGVMGAPIFSMFLLGMTVPFANYKGVLAGSMSCFALLLWVSVGAALHKVNHASRDIYGHMPSTCPNFNGTYSQNGYSNATQRWVIYVLIYIYIGLYIQILGMVESHDVFI
jgi:hypothetical protein